MRVGTKRKMPPQKISAARKRSTTAKGSNTETFDMAT